MRARARDNLHRQDHQNLNLILLNSFFLANDLCAVASSFSMQTLSVNEILAVNGRFPTLSDPPRGLRDELDPWAKAKRPFKETGPPIFASSRVGTVLDAAKSLTAVVNVSRRGRKNARESERRSGIHTHPPTHTRVCISE